MNKSNINSLISDFKCPGCKYRGAPFWAWNGKLEPDELRRQIRLMHEMGMGGFFMHARVGLETAYLSDDWFDCVKACIDEAEKLDMQAWLYDEDRFPSGAAGGLVTAAPQYRSRRVVMYELDAAAVGRFKPSGELLAIFAGQVIGCKLKAVRRLEGLKSKLHSGETMLYFQVETQPCSSWYNGQTYLDTLNPEAVRQFIEVTHEEYRKRIGDKFGKRVPGIFTDEPNFGEICSKVADNAWSNPWTGKLAEVFHSRYGYDLIEHLPELFYDVDGTALSRARLNYLDCITFLFVDSFSRQIGEWCGKNDMQFTGHALWEDTLSRQTYFSGSVMRFYEYMQAPGVDLVTEHRRIYDTVKQMTSVAHQFDRRWRITESYGCTGWDFPFSGHKALCDWQAALGINMRCQHLAWYTMAAEAKRDYPAAIFYQSPWYREYRHVEDYFARINYVMDHGREVRDLLVIHPVESTWTMIRKDWMTDKSVFANDKKLIRLRDCLLSAGLDFDYGEEELMSRHASIAGEKGCPVLQIAKASYKAVVVPEMVTIRASTVKLLREFAEHGGNVVFVGKPAAYVDGLPSADVAKLASACSTVKKEGQALVAAVETIVRRIKIADAGGNNIASTLYLLRQDDQAEYLFLCNSGHDDKEINDKNGMEDLTRVCDRQRSCPQVTISVKTDKKGAVLEFDPETGKIYQADAEKTANGWNITTSLPALGSRMFVVNAAAAGKYPRRAQLKTVRKQTPFIADWKYRLNEDNVVVFDHFRAKTGNGKTGVSEYFCRLDDRLRHQIGCDPRGGAMVQPWVKQRDSGKTIHLVVTAEFYCDALPSGPVYLGIEFSELYRIKINGVYLAMDSECGWWCDRSLRKLPVNTAMLRRGYNEIVMECDYNGQHPGLEMIYLLGDFGTKIKGSSTTITAPLKQLKIGDWCKQGLSFYSGSVIYSAMVKISLKKDERLFVTIPKYGGACLRILINSVQAGLIAWPPQELDITGFVTNDKFELGIEVISSRRNSHGPFHCKSKWPAWTGPVEFKQYDVANYQLVPCGLLESPVLEIRKTIGGQTI